MGERYEAMAWLGALVIGVGVSMTTSAQSRKN